MRHSPGRAARPPNCLPPTACRVRLPPPPCLQWSVTGDHVNFPFGSPSPPFVLRTVEGNEPDKIVVISNQTTAGWELTAFTADTGIWEAALLLCLSCLRACPVTASAAATPCPLLRPVLPRA